MKKAIIATLMSLPLYGALAAAPVLTTATPAVAAPSAQLVALVERKLRAYNLSAPVDRMTTNSVTALYAILLSGDRYLKKRLRLKTAIANATYYR